MPRLEGESNKLLFGSGFGEFLVRAGWSGGRRPSTFFCFFFCSVWVLQLPKVNEGFHELSGFRFSISISLSPSFPLSIFLHDVGGVDGWKLCKLYLQLQISCFFESLNERTLILNFPGRVGTCALWTSTCAKAFSSFSNFPPFHRSPSPGKRKTQKSKSNRELEPKLNRKSLLWCGMDEEMSEPKWIVLSARNSGPGREEN